MPEKTFNYKEGKSDLFTKVKRPLIDIEAFSENRNIWVLLYEVLADTGADISIFPRIIGRLIFNDITDGKQIEIRGVVPYSRLICYLHKVKVRINGRNFTMPVAVADSDDAPLILGRVNGLDLFDASFLKGKKVKIKWE